MSDVSALLDEAQRRPLSGWDLSYDGRIGFAPPWDFEAHVDPRIAAAPDLLDMGTGGGEWLSGRPFRRAVATEGWLPNVPVARSRLAPLGVSVVAVVGAPDNIDQTDAADLPALPFRDGAFDLVTNRHESFVAAEVARVMKAGGAFVTQQVAGDPGAPFRALLGAGAHPTPPAWRLAFATDQVVAAGLEVTQSAEGDAALTFADVGALAWYLANVPWVMPEFTVAAHRAALETLAPRGEIAVPQPMFWLAARKR